MTDQLITDLARVDPDRLGVVARTSSTRFATGGAAIERAAGELGADYALEGSVLREGGVVRITARLVRVADRTHVWAESFDRGTDEVLSVRDEVARRVIEAVAPDLLGEWPGPAPGGAPLPASAGASERYMVARGLLDTRDPDRLERARAEFERVLEVEPDFVPALTGRAEALMRQGRGEEARAPLHRALALDPDDAVAHHLLGQVLLFREWRWSDARGHIERSIRLAPGRAAAHQVRAYWLAMTGRLDQAVVSMETALRLDPLSAYVHADAGWIDYWAGRSEEAIARCERTLELEPASASARTCLLFTRIDRKDHRGARADARAMMEALGATAAELRDFDDAPAPEAALERYWRWEVGRLERGPDRSADDEFLLALAHARLGRPDAAFRHLEAARRGHTSWMLWLEVEPMLAPLREDPRWPDLVARMGYPDLRGK